MLLDQTKYIKSYKYPSLEWKRLGISPLGVVNFKKSYKITM